ncbi:MAG: hypothetical protein WDO17_17800 [Alphaproteobacteria bacterium]
MKILIGLLAALVITAGGYFGFEFYLQQRITNDVEATFASVRASGAKAEHGKVTFDLWRRTVTIADISGELTADPPVRLKIGRVVASGVSQPDTGRFAASRIEVTDFEAAGSIGTNTGLRASYQAPRMDVTDYAGPAGPLRRLESSNLADIYRFALEHFSAAAAKSVEVPALTLKFTPSGSSPAAGTGDYTYSGMALRDIKDGKIASSTVERVAFTVAMSPAGKSESLTGEIVNLAAYDFDASATLAMLDPARANDDKYYRTYRQLTAGAYTASFQKGLKMRVDGVTVDDVGLRPSRLQFPQLMAIIDSAPPPGTTPTPEQMRDLLGKVAGIYEGIHIGGATISGLSMDLPEGVFKLAAARLINLENGKIAEFAFEGLAGKTPQGPVTVERFALKAIDIAGLMRTSGEFAQPGRTPAVEQLVGLLTLLQGAELKGLAAPYRSVVPRLGRPSSRVRPDNNANSQVNIDVLNLAWGQFVGPIPTRARVTLKMAGPIDQSDPEPFKMLAETGLTSTSVNFDLGATWNEGDRSFAVQPGTLDIGNVLTAAVRLSLANVDRGVFSLNPLQAAIMAAQIEAGPVEFTLRDTGGIDLAITQQARQQKVSREAARQAITDAIRDSAMQLASANPDVMAVAGALTRFIENPRGTLTIKVTPRGKVSAMQVLESIRTGSLAAFARFQIEATTGR